MVLSQQRLKELFDYREDGNFIRRIRTSSRTNVGEVAGSLDANGYVVTKVDGHNYKNHRLVWLFHHGYLPENDIDHKDRVKTHNWVENLREAGKQCNSRNTGNHKTNTSGVKGVHWNRQSEKWVASVKINRKKIHLGLHSDFTEAVAHRLAAEQAENWHGCDSSSPAFKYMQTCLGGSK